MFENPRFAESWSRPVVFGALLAGALVRVAAAMTLGPHIDEAESVLAARMVAEGGWPIFPSGLVFLQGLTVPVQRVRGAVQAVQIHTFEVVVNELAQARRVLGGERNALRAHAHGKAQLLRRLGDGAVDAVGNIRPTGHR